MITISANTAPIQQQLQRLAARVADLRPVMADVAEAMLESVRDNLDNERGPSGPWPELAAATILRRQLQGKWPGKMLQVSGTLKNTITPGHDGHSAFVTAPARYAAIHHFGGPAGRGGKVNIPARPFMYLDNESQAEVFDTLSRHLERALTV